MRSLNDVLANVENTIFYLENIDKYQLGGDSIKNVISSMNDIFVDIVHIQNISRDMLYREDD